MSLLGLLTGRAWLHAGDRNLGEIAYSIRVGVENGQRRANGILSGSERTMAAAHAGDEVRLVLKTGEEILAYIQDANLARAIFSVPGEVPGF